MCSTCRALWKGMIVPHAEMDCPIRNSRYCSTCAQYGHLTSACPAAPSKQFTEPVFVEQLIPHSILKEYKITTRTPLPVIIKEEPQQILEIQDNDKVIAAYLSAHSIKTIKGCTKRHTLEEYAKQVGKRVVYVA